MRALIPRRGAVLLLVLALMLVAVGCGGDGGSNASSPAATAADVSAEQIVKDSEAKMATVGSASFVADLGLEIQGDAEKMTDPTAKALLSQGVTFHAQGSSGSDPTAVNMTMSLAIAGQNLEFGMMAEGDKAWIEYQGAWYALDTKNAKALDKQAQSGGTPTEQLKSMGIDPSSWGTEYELVGTETLDGVEVYHIKAVADPQKLADSLMKAAESPKLQEQLGDTGDLSQLGQGLTEDKAQAEEVAKSLKDATVDYWIGVEEPYMYKAQFGASLDTTGQKDMDGVTGMTVKGTVGMSAFDEPVEVEAPKNAKPFDTFMNELFGSMMTGSESMSF